MSLRIALVVGVLGIAYKMMTGDATWSNRLGYIARTIVGDTPAQFFERRTWTNEKGQLSASSVVDRLRAERNERLHSAVAALYV